MLEAFPKVEHIYQNHTLDSTRWEQFQPRPDDIVVATTYKSGTTWMQNIVLNLIFQDLQIHDINQLSPWLDNCLGPLDETLSQLEAQQHRRCIKTHLPLDGLRYLPQVKYVYVGRDARDVFMSGWNHYNNYKPEVYLMLNDPTRLVGAPCRRRQRIFEKPGVTR